MSRQDRCCTESATSTCTRVAAKPLRVTASTRSATGSGETASTAAWMVSTGTPAPTSAPSSMSPLAPDDASTHRVVIAAALATRAAKTPAPYPLSMLTTVTPGAQELSIASSAASPPNEAPYPTLVGTATIGTPVSPPTTDGSAPSMPATTTRQSAASSRSWTAEQPVQPGHSDVLDELYRRAVHPDRQRGLGRDRRVTGAGRDHGDRAPRLRERTERHRPGHRVDVGLGQRRRHLGERLLGEPGREHRPLGVPLVEGAQDRDDLAGRLAGAVDDLGVPGPPRAVDVDAREAEVARSPGRGSFSTRAG